MLGSSTVINGSGLGFGRIRQRLADGDLGDAGDGHDVARPGTFGRHPVQRFGQHHLRQLEVADGAVGLAPGHHLVALHLTGDDPAEGDPTEVGRSVEVGHVSLQDRALFVDRGRDVGEDGGEQRRQVLGVRHLTVRGLVHRRPPGLRAGVDDREVEDVDVGVVQQVQEELVGLFDDLLDPGVRSVDLVHHDHDRQSLGQRLTQHEPGLGQWPLGGVDQQQDAVDHLQATLDLATEVGVSGGVDDVDDDVGAVRCVVQHRGVLGQDGDALFALQVHRVHHPVVDVLVGPEGTGLPQHGIDKGRLAVVDVRHDGDVAQVRTNGHDRNS